MPSSSDEVATIAAERAAPSARPRPRAAARGRASRGGRARGPRRRARSAGRRGARPAGGRSRRRSSSGARGSARAAAGGSTARSTPCGDGRPGGSELDRLRWAARSTAPSSAMSSTGTTTSSSIGLRCPASTIVTGRGAPSVAWPPRNRAISSSGRCVADRPIRCGGVVARCASSRSSESARCAPRFVAGERVDLVDDHPPDAAQGLAGRRGEHQVERLRRRDQDVGRVASGAGGARSAGVSPVRTPTDGLVRRVGSPRRSAASRIPASGARRFFSTSTASARSGEMYSDPGPRGRHRAAARSRAGRSPTGTRRASCPSRWGRGSACGRRRRSPASPATGPSVGASNDASNQARTAGEKALRLTPERYRAPPTRVGRRRGCAGARR